MPHRSLLGNEGIHASDAESAADRHSVIASYLQIIASVEKIHAAQGHAPFPGRFTKQYGCKGIALCPALEQL